MVYGMYWTCLVFACRWVRWRWMVSSNPSASQCSVNSSLRQWRPWICPCLAASAWGATATSEPLRRAAPRTTSAYRCGPHLPHVQPPRWGPSRAVLVSNKKGNPEEWRKGKVCFCAAPSDQWWALLIDTKPIRKSVFHQGAAQANQPKTTTDQGWCSCGAFSIQANLFWAKST